MEGGGNRMKTRRDPLAEALKIKQNSSEETAGGSTPFAPASADICELFMDELRSRRERLEHWLLILEQQVRSDERAKRRRVPGEQRRVCGVESSHRRASAGRAEISGHDSNVGAA